MTFPNHVMIVGGHRADLDMPCVERRHHYSKRPFQDLQKKKKNNVHSLFSGLFCLNYD